MAVSKLEAVLSLNNKNFSSGLKKSQKEVELFGNGLNKLETTIAAAFSTAAIIAFSKEMAVVNRQVYNASIAFERFGGSDQYMERLQKSTGYMLDNLFLMQQTIQATNLGLKQADLPKFFEFATIRAQETGVAVEYLINSIVTGVGRESRLVLDNLGISLKALNKEIEKVGNFSDAAFNLMQREIDNTDRSVEEATGGVQQLGAAWKNFVQFLADSDVGDYFEEVARKATGILDALSGPKSVFATIEDAKSFLGIDIISTKEDVLELIEHFKQLKRTSEVKTAESYLYETIFDSDREKGLRNYIGALELLEEMLTNPIEVPENSIGGFLSNMNDAWAIPTTRMGAVSNIAGMDALGGSYGLDMFETERASQGVELLIDHLQNGTEELKDFADAFVDAGREGREFANQLTSDLEPALINIGNTLAEVASIGIMSLGDAILSLVSGGDPLNVLADFLSELGRMLVMYGSSLIALGIGEQMAMSGGPIGAIAGGAIIAAAGVALAAIGGAMNNSISGGSLSGGSGGGYGSYGGGVNYGTVGAYDQNREVVLVARGDDLVAVLNRNDYRNYTNGG